MLLTLFAAVSLAAAFRMQVQGLAWLAAVGGMLTALTLILRVGEWAPYALFLIALGVGTLWLGYIREWRGLRWPAGILAVMGTLGVTSRALAVPPVDAALTAWMVQGTLVVGYLASIAIRTLVRGRQVIVFEVVQTPLVLIVGVGGALAVSQSVGSGGLLLGGTLIVLGIATYLVSFQFLPRESRGALNFYFYSSLALVFVVIGLRTALSGAPQAVALTAFAALLAVAWSRSGRVSLGGHAALALVAAAISGGLLRLDESAFAGELPSVQLLWPALATLAVALVIESSAAAATRRARVAWADVPTLVIAALGLAGLAALVTIGLGRAFGLDADPGQLGTLRTAVLSALAVGCALLNRPGRFSAVGKLAYPLLALIGLKLAVVDLQVLHPRDVVRGARLLRNGARPRTATATGNQLVSSKLTNRLEPRTVELSPAGCLVPDTGHRVPARLTDFRLFLYRRIPAERLHPEAGAAAAVQIAAEVALAAGLQRHRQVAVEAAAEAVEVEGAARVVGQAQPHVAAEAVDVQPVALVPGAGAEPDVAAERLQPMRALHVLHLDRRAERVHVQPHRRRHLDVEVGLDDVVVVAFYSLVVGLNLDVVAVLRHLERDVAQPVGPSPPHGVDHDLIAAGAADIDATGEGPQAERAAGLDRKGAVEGFFLLRLGAGRDGRSDERRDEQGKGAANRAGKAGHGHLVSAAAESVRPCACEEIDGE